MAQHSVVLMQHLLEFKSKTSCNIAVPFSCEQYDATLTLLQQCNKFTSMQSLSPDSEACDFVLGSIYIFKINFCHIVASNTNVRLGQGLGQGQGQSLEVFFIIDHLLHQVLHQVGQGQGCYLLIRCCIRCCITT